MRMQIRWMVACVVLFGACASEHNTTPGVIAASGLVEGTVVAGGVPGSGSVGASAMVGGTVVNGAGSGRENGLSPSALVEFDTCDAFIGHVKAEALERVGPYGLTGGPEMVAMAMEAEAAAIADSSVSTPSTPGVVYSTTNIQEVGVDEPDVVKTDGDRILVLESRVLYYIDLSTGYPVLAGSFNPWSLESRESSYWRGSNVWSEDMFVSGDTALLLARGFGWGAGEYTQVLQVDISDPENLTVVRALTVEGTYLSARLVGERVRLVTAYRPEPRIPFVRPNSFTGEAAAERYNRRLIKWSTSAHWAPRYLLEDADRASWGLSIDCDSSYVPTEFSGFDFLSVLSFDLAGEIDPEAVSTVMSGGETVYASSTNLYVATQRWADWRQFDEDQAIREVDTMTTEIHQFDISGSDGAEYLASGAVDGFLLNQFAMSEHGGYLRVASTTAPDWGWWLGEDRTTASRVDVMERDGRELRIVGSAGGLGEGERIFAVRFMGDVGYVVTFRRIDPLYTIDLSDPEHPRVLGELKIPGYSAYLHPIGEGLLLGIGQDADQEGRTLGTQVSVFDVSDLADPTRIHQFTSSESYTEIEWDHRAFLYWGPTGMAVIPLIRWQDDSESDPGRDSDISYEVWVLAVGAGGVDELTTIDHEVVVTKEGCCDLFRGSFPIRRSLVVGDTLFTLSRGGLMGTDLDTFSLTSWTGFPLRPYGTPVLVTD